MAIFTSSGVIYGPNWRKPKIRRSVIRAVVKGAGVKRADKVVPFEAKDYLFYVCIVCSVYVRPCNAS